MKTVATICARGGSKGLPRKNVLPLGGKPLIAHTIEQALACPLIDGVYVSTDDDEIADVARRFGARVPYRRPAELASDQAAKIPAIEHLIAHLEGQGEQISTVVDLQPTSPLRLQQDLIAAIEQARETEAELVVTVTEPSHNPYYTLVEVDAGGTLRLSKPGDLVRRQDMPAVWGLNGCHLCMEAESVGPGGTGRFLERFHAPQRDAAGAVDRHRQPARFRMGRMAVSQATGEALMTTHRVFVIAEAGVNHNGSLDLAFQLVEAARAAGADAVKFQTFRAEDVVTPTAVTADYQRSNTGETNQFEMIKKLELDEEAHRRLALHCAAQGIEFFSTPFSEDAVAMLVRQGVRRLKLPSGEITNRRLLECAADTGLPLLMSSGMATLDEVERAVQWIAARWRAAGRPAPDATEPDSAALHVGLPRAGRFAEPAGDRDDRGRHRLAGWLFGSQRRDRGRGCSGRAGCHRH